MSIDARVVGIRKLRGEDCVKLTLEDRPGGGPAGQETLRIINTAEVQQTPGWSITLKKLIGRDIWGGSSEIMLGDRKLASRRGYVKIILVPNWPDVIESEQGG